MDHDLATFNPISEELNHGQTLNSQSLAYPATGSGVAEVRVILSGFVIHGYLGMTTFLVSLHFFPTTAATFWIAMLIVSVG